MEMIIQEQSTQHVISRPTRCDITAWAHGDSQWSLTPRLLSNVNIQNVDRVLLGGSLAGLTNSMCSIWQESS